MCICHSHVHRVLYKERGIFTPARKEIKNLDKNPGSRRPLQISVTCPNPIGANAQITHRKKPNGQRGKMLARTQIKSESCKTGETHTPCCS